MTSKSKTNLTYYAKLLDVARKAFFKDHSKDKLGKLSIPDWHLRLDQFISSSTELVSTFFPKLV